MTSLSKPRNGTLLHGNFPLYRLVVLIASLSLSFLLGYAFAQGQANDAYLNFNYEQTVKDICRKSISPECRKARGKLPDYPVPDPKAAR